MIINNKNKNHHHHLYFFIFALFPADLGEKERLAVYCCVVIPVPCREFLGALRARARNLARQCGKGC